MTEQETQQTQQSKNSAAGTMGHIFSFMPLIVVPIIFMPLAIVCGLTSLLQGKVGHGLAIIFLAIVAGCIGASIAAWGLGLPKLG